MIVGSIVLAAVAVGLLVGGWFGGSDLLYVSSIAASMLAAIALVVGVRQFPRLRPAGVALGPGRPPRGIGRAGAPRPGRARATAPVPTVTGDDGEGDPLDEPAAQVLTPAEEAVLARLDADVVVVDGRPRFHAVDCLHLLGRERQRLGVGEAARLGFTPCGQCAPATPLLARPSSP